MSEKERSTELAYRMQTDLSAMGGAKAARLRLRQVINALSTIDVKVACEIHPCVVFRCGTSEFRVRERLKGSIRATRNPHGPAGDLLVRRGDTSPPERLAKFCDHRAAA